MIDTTRPANAERLASAVYEALTIDAQDFFERPDGVQVIIVNNGWTLAISDDTGEDAPNGLSWWIDSPEEKGIHSDGWEELPDADVAGQAASLADYFRHVSTSTIGRVVERLNTIHWDDFGEIEDYIDAKVDRWATLGDPSSGPDECSVLVKIGDDVSLIDWCYGDKFVEQRFAVYSAGELAALLNSCRDQGGGNVSFIIGEACDNARYLREPPVVGWNVTFGDDVSVLKQVDGVWNATTQPRAPGHYNTRYATYKAAQADGWRRIDRFADRDVSGIGYGGATMFGYKFESQDGQTSTTVMLTEERNNAGQPGCFVEMFRVIGGSA